MKFPVKITKDGDEYTVNSQELLDFHRNQGWELAEGEVEESDEIDEDADLPEALQMIDKRFTAVETVVAKVEGEVTAQAADLESLRQLVDLQTATIAALSEQVAALAPAPTEPAAPAPTEPAAPEAPPAAPPVPPIPPVADGK